jgi:hypothetical protein
MVLMYTVSQSNDSTKNKILQRDDIPHVAVVHISDTTLMEVKCIVSVNVTRLCGPLKS